MAVPVAPAPPEPPVPSVVVAGHTLAEASRDSLRDAQEGVLNGLLASSSQPEVLSKPGPSRARGWVSVPATPTPPADSRCPHGPGPVLGSVRTPGGQASRSADSVGAGLAARVGSDAARPVDPDKAPQTGRLPGARAWPAHAPVVFSSRESMRPRHLLMTWRLAKSPDQPPTHIPVTPIVSSGPPKRPGRQTVPSFPSYPWKAEAQSWAVGKQ